MFAGPNGSGKSTLPTKLKPQWVGMYVNADEIEKALRTQPGGLDLGVFGISCTPDEFRAFLKGSALLANKGHLAEALDFRLDGARLTYEPALVNSYLAAVLAEFIRDRLLASQVSFSFETVMSSPDKIDLLRRAKAAGFRIYLYFVATDDPDINISRIASRVRLGGHGVPDDKVRERYQRSLDLLLDAIRYSNRAYVFDNSGEDLELQAEITQGRDIEFKTDALAPWFQDAVIQKLTMEGSVHRPEP